MAVQSQISINAQISLLENKMSQFKPDSNGKLPPAFYALQGKVAKLKKQLITTSPSKSWYEYLSK